MARIPSSTPVLALLAVGVALVAVPVLAPPDVPNDRVEYYVEGNWGNYSDQEFVVYDNMSSSAQSVFDTARTERPETVNVSVPESPPSITPEPDTIDIYNVRYESEVYLLQVRHLTYEADFLTQQLPRLGSLSLGIVVAVFAAYRHWN